MSKPWLRCWGDVIWTGERVTVTFTHCLRVDGDTLHTSTRRAQRRRWAESQRCMASQINDHTVIFGSFAGRPHIHHTCPWCHGEPWKVLEEKRRPGGGMRSCEMPLPYGECTRQRPTCAVWFARRISGCLALSPAGGHPNPLAASRCMSIALCLCGSDWGLKEKARVGSAALSIPCGLRGVVLKCGIAQMNGNVNSGKAIISTDKPTNPWMYCENNWLVVWNHGILFFHILGNSSPQLTFTPSFFRGVGQPPTW